MAYYMYSFVWGSEGSVLSMMDADRHAGRDAAREALLGSCSSGVAAQRSFAVLLRSHLSSPKARCSSATTSCVPSGLLSSMTMIS